MMSKKKRQGNNINKQTLTNSLLGIFSNDPGKSYNYKQLAKILLLRSSEEKKLISTVLYQMNQNGYIEEIYTGKFKLKSSGGYVVGKLQITSAGYGYVFTDAFEEEVFISQKNLNRAFDGDVVKVYLFARKKKKNQEGEIVEVIEREKDTFICIVELSDNYAFCIPDKRHIPYDIFVPSEKLMGAKNGEKVLVKISSWPQQAKNPVGEIIKVFGTPGNHETEMHAILAEFGLPYNFSEEAENAANLISDTIPEHEIAERRDFTQITTFTVDPEDAKDFDDALSIQQLQNGNWEIGVHIADVTYYVHSKSVLDKESYERGTSVYLVDRVVPMLPERLSNNICSLKPCEKKLCFSAVFELDKDANLMDEWFGKTIIYSNRRFTYAEAQKILDAKNGDYSTELLQLNNLAQKLRQMRYNDGAISFDREEVRFEIDEMGKPLTIKFREHGTSNELIEEFMLLANKRVACFIGDVKNKKDRKTFVYRVHDKPNQEKLLKFSNFIRKFGYNIHLSSQNKISDSINNLLDIIKGKPEQNIIETLAVRSMAKAEYSTINIGHYGLAFKYYTHFTSPIRRYPDIMVHRLLFDYLNNAESKNRKKYEERCQHSSDMEQRAVDAERASIKYKQVEFMQDKIGKVFNGLISGVTEFGIFVEIIENKCEGLVALRDLTDDFYEFDEDNYLLTGRHTRKIFQLGDPVKIEVLRANLIKKQLDFTIFKESQVLK